MPERLTEVDLLKGLAIIAVILVHTWSIPVLLAIGAPFHMLHAGVLLILIAGFNGVYSYRRHGFNTPGQCYSHQLLYRRFSRLLKPYILMWLLQVAVVVFLLHGSVDLRSLFLNFISGGYGLGAYFVPVIIQSVLVVPLLYLLALRSPDMMLLLAFILNLVFEFLFFISGFPFSIYALLYAEFLFAGALGVWLATSAKRPVLWIAAGGILSGLYIAVTFYTGLLSRFFETYLGNITQAPAYFWTFILVLSGFTLLPKKTGTRVVQGIANAGKASWHIFLVQMSFFYFLWPALGYYVLIPVINFFPASLSFCGLLVAAVITTILCAGSGYLWYKAEESWANFRHMPKKSLSG
jgi:peptidoglycan/LPS O-acetylase OafA/YrhL